MGCISESSQVVGCVLASQIPLKSSRMRVWKSVSPACNILLVIPEGPGDLSGSSFFISISSSWGVKGSMKRGCVAGVAIDARVFTCLWREATFRASFSSYGESG